jgi:hypothetical protein
MYIQFVTTAHRYDVKQENVCWLHNSAALEQADYEK